MQYGCMHVMLKMNTDSISKSGTLGMPFAQEHPLSILVAEDNPINKKVILTMLKRLGYDADAVENGALCLTAVLNGSYDLVLSDIDMPEMDGLECTKRLRAAGVRIPIVAVTASSLYALDSCLAAGMDGYLPKPLPPGELLSTLERAFEAKMRRLDGE